MVNYKGKQNYPIGVLEKGRDAMGVPVRKNKEEF